MTKIKKPKLIPASQWGEALHTSLRKCCDSTATTIAYQAIDLLNDGWRQYLEHLKKTMHQDAGTDGSVWKNLKEASLKWDCYKTPRHEFSQAVILHCAMKLFDDGDWQGYAEFLVQ